MRRLDDTLNRLQLDGSWLGFTVNLQDLAGAALATGIVLAVAGLVTGALMLAATQIFGAEIPSKALRRMITAVLAAIVLGSLSGMVGWGMQYDMPL